MVRECALALFFWAAVQAAFALMYGPTLLAHAGILGAGSLWLFLRRSRAAAVLLLLYALSGAGITLAIRSGVPLEGGKNVMLALIIVWTAIKAVEATFRLRGRFSLAPEAAPDPATDTRAAG